MATLTGFDANKVEPQTARVPLPAGDYKAAITASEMKQNSKKNGSFLSLEFSVLEGEQKGRKLFANLNLDNPNKQAVEIAKSELSAICRSVGVMTPQDSAELHNKPLWLTVGLEKRKDNNEMSNRIKGYKSLADGNAAVAAAPVAAGGAAPWAS
jgi:hypothetical protein